MYSQDKLDTLVEDSMNSHIMELASDIADSLVQETIEKPYVTDENGDQSYTDEAQDIFNEHYGYWMNICYEFVNNTIKIHNSK